MQGNENGPDGDTRTSCQSLVWAVWSLISSLLKLSRSPFSYPLSVFFLFSLFCFTALLFRFGKSRLLTAQLMLFRCLLLEWYFVRRLQRAMGLNTQSKDLRVLFVKTSGFLCI